MGVVHKPDPGWGTHIPALIKCLELTKAPDGHENPVLELGMGMSSTPLLHALCEDQRRLLVSLDNDGRFIDMFRKYHTKGHSFWLVDSWADQRLDFESWRVALVDHKPAERRKEDTKRLTEVDYVVIHDSEDPLYGYDEIYPLFKYRYDYKKFNTWTTVLSNKHDVDNIFRNS